MSEGSDSDGGLENRETMEPPPGKLLPLNSRRLTAAHLRHLAGSMKLPSTGSADEVRQLIEGKLQEEHEVWNVQVDLEEAPILKVKLSLTDENGVFLETEPIQKSLQTPVDSVDLEHKLEKATFEKAVAALREVLGPGRKVLVAQDFRHTTQNEGESVSTFIRRLERSFSIAYGTDQLSGETRDAFLYGQLQERLRQELMHSPCVSRALNYKELVMAVKNEEKRLSELRKRQQYLKSQASSSSRPQASGTTAPTRSVNTRANDYSLPSSQEQSNRIRCHHCRKTGHIKKYCPERRTESTGNRQQPRRNQQSTTAKQVTTDGTEVSTSEDPFSYRYSDSSDEMQDVKTVRVNEKLHQYADSNRKTSNLQTPLLVPTIRNLSHSMAVSILTLPLVTLQ